MGYILMLPFWESAICQPTTYVPLVLCQRIVSPIARLCLASSFYNDWLLVIIIMNWEAFEEFALEFTSPKHLSTKQSKGTS